MAHGSYMVLIRCHFILFENDANQFVSFNDLENDISSKKLLLLQRRFIKHYYYSNIIFAFCFVNYYSPITKVKYIN